MMPPAGGWAVDVQVGGREYHLEGPPTYIADNLYRLHDDAKQPISMQRVWDFLNTTWQSRDPLRAINAQGHRTEPAVLQSSDAHITTSPRVYGPALWASLNIFGMKDAFNKDRWLGAINQVTDTLDISKSPFTGCVECFELWSIIRLGSDPDAVENEHDAAQWVWNAHNRVNQSLGKPQMLFATAVVLHGWAFEVEDSNTTPA